MRFYVLNVQQKSAYSLQPWIINRREIMKKETKPNKLLLLHMKNVNLYSYVLQQFLKPLLCRFIIVGLSLQLLEKLCLFFRQIS
jgi:hypothetical protein